MKPITTTLALKDTALEITNPLGIVKCMTYLTMNNDFQ